MVKWCATALIAILILVGCTTAPEVAPVDTTGTGETAESGTVPDVADGTESQETPEPDVTDETEPTPEPEVPTAPIEVPEEVYNRAFEEVEAVITELNQIIQRGDYEEWLSYLTEDYIDYHGHPQVLEDLSEQPLLVQNNITLRNLHDYFQQVVRPSRARARLDSLVFYSDTLVEAVTVFRGQSVTLYVLRNIDGEWRIDSLEEPPSDSNE